MFPHTLFIPSTSFVVFAAGEVSELDALIARAKASEEEAQLELGKYYLLRAGVEDGSGDNARQGVSWLIRASRQGNQEATTLLRDCLQKQLGKCKYFIQVLVSFFLNSVYCILRYMRTNQIASYLADFPVTGIEFVHGSDWTSAMT